MEELAGFKKPVRTTRVERLTLAVLAAKLKQ
jgi:hypothetical protein